MSQGLEPLVPLARTAVSGIGDVAASAWTLFRARRAALACLSASPRPDLALLVDYPGFNLPLARRARALGIPVYYVAPPQAWIYRDPAAKAARASRSLQGAVVHVLFPFERETFAAAATEVVSGHFLEEAMAAGAEAVGGAPGSEAVAASGAGAESGGASGTDVFRAGERGVLALCPGSRLPALRRNLSAWLPALRAAGVLDDPGVSGTRILVPAHLVAEVRTAVAAALGADPGPPDPAPSRPGSPAPRLALVTGKGRLLRDADWAFAFPGTVTLELALAGVPAAVLAALDPLTLAAGRRIVKGPWLGLPNLLLGREAFPEWAGRASALSPGVAAGLWNRLRSLPPRTAAEACGTLRGLMGPAGGAGVAAAECLKILEKS